MLPALARGRAQRLQVRVWAWSCLAAGLAVAGCGSSSEATDGAVTVSDPVEALAPLVRIHPRERLLPMSADRYLARASLHWADDNGCLHRRLAAAGQLRPAALGAGSAHALRRTDPQCRSVGGRSYRPSDPSHPYLPERDRGGLSLGEGFYLEVPARTGAREELDGYRRVPPEVPAYYEARRERVEGDPGLRIAYWLFYGRSASTWLEWWPNDDGPRFWGRDHVVREGDWERVDVLARSVDGGYEPVSLRIHTDLGDRTVAWEDVERSQRTHPVLYAALGSHMLFARPGFHKRPEVRPTGNYIVVDDTAGCHGCPHWRTWRRLVDATTRPWHGYGGAWGDDGATPGTTGSRGPGGE